MKAFVVCVMLTLCVATVYGKSLEERVAALEKKTKDDACVDLCYDAHSDCLKGCSGHQCTLCLNQLMTCVFSEGCNIHGDKTGTENNLPQKKDLSSLLELLLKQLDQ